MNRFLPSLHLCICLLALPMAARAVNLDAEVLARTGMIAPDVVRAHMAEFGFTPEQEATLRRMSEESRPKLAELDAAVRTEKQKLEDSVKAADVTTTTAAARLDKLLEAESALKHFQLAKLIELRAVLTPEQRTLAQKLALKDSVKHSPVVSRLKKKADALRAAWSDLGIEPPPALTAKGNEIEKLAHEGKLEEADQALDALIEETGLNVPDSTDAIDFSKFETGSTDFETLKERYASVASRAKVLVRLPTLKLLLKGRDQLEKAKEAQDADRVARILTWAEGLLAKEMP